MGHQTHFIKMAKLKCQRQPKNMAHLVFFSTQGRIKLSEIKSNSKNNKLIWEIFPFGDKSWIEKLKC